MWYLLQGGSSVKVVFTLSYSNGVHVKTLLTRLNILHLKSLSERLGHAPFRTDHHIVMGLVPKVISQRWRGPRLPPSFDVKRLAVQNDIAT